MKNVIPILLGMVFLCGSLRSEEIVSNGLGGGPWSEPGSWRGNAVPGPKDEVVIQKRDVIVFDRDDDGKTSCARLNIDPKGVLQFKTGAGKLVCSVSGEVETHGAIKLDGTRSAKDSLELRLTGSKAEERKIKVGRGGALLLYGGRDLPEGHCNVALTAPQPKDKEEVAAVVETDRGASIDWQRARVAEFLLSAKNLDNTGAQANERCNVMDCIFQGQGRIACDGCDTPVIARSVFEYRGKNRHADAAIQVVASPLAEIKGNTVRGGFRIGINFHRQTDSVLMGNTVEKCEFGIAGGGGLPNAMVKDCTVRGCVFGLDLEGATGVAENMAIEGGTTGVHVRNSNLQLNSVEVKNLEAKGTALLWESGTVKMLGGNIVPAQIKLNAPSDLPADKPALPVTAFGYLQVVVKDAPADARVEVRTDDPKLAADAGDSNVRHSPAPLVKGQSPAPGKLNALVVKCWDLNRKSTTVAGPTYRVQILGPAPNADSPRPVLKTITYRPTVDARTGSLAPLEVSLK